MCADFSKVASASGDCLMSFCGTVVYVLYGLKQLVPTEASCHKPEPGLAAAPQWRHTMSVGSCLGDYNQATWEPTLQHRWTITQMDHTAEG